MGTNNMESKIIRAVYDSAIVNLDAYIIMHRIDNKLAEKKAALLDKVAQIPDNDLRMDLTRLVNEL